MQDKRDLLLHPQPSSKDENVVNQFSLMKQENEKLLMENIALKKKLEKEEFYHQNLYKQWSELNASVIEKERELQQLKSAQNPKLKGYQYAFYGLLVVILIVAAFNYSSTKSGGKNSTPLQTSSPQNNIDSQTISYATSHQGEVSDSNDKISHKELVTPPPEINKDQPLLPDKAAGKRPVHYLVKTKSYFHNDADANTKRNTFVLPWNDAYGILTALDDKNGFIYVVFKNRAGRTSTGWIRKIDLELIKN
ncbi:MAG: hypothetical protein ABIO55_01760 [Ginsengibacter sp.]